MILPIPQAPKKEKQKKRHEFVLVCAWCPKEEYPQLSVFADYTHGICKIHARELVERLRQKVH